jgi:uncharacterized protein (TIGR01244 family)
MSTEIANFAHICDGLDAAGQPTTAQLQQLGALGYRTVLNLREANEAGVEAEAALVASIGLRYLHVGVSASSFSSALVDQCAAVLNDPSAAPILCHCSTSNRVGAVIAVMHARAGHSIEEALAEGARAGLKAEGMVAAVKKVIEAERQK